ncbi:putative 3-methyladenine DNA glycosylase [Anabrus simplex]|uniref:putative 3-methyladenine DNA glycosylase n=1 Tax=Anabrus simplex TaxID=316456 RepID=UPI0034DD1FD8
MKRRKAGQSGATRKSKRVMKENAVLKNEEEEQIVVKSKANSSHKKKEAKKTSEEQLLLELEQDYLTVNRNLKPSVGLHRLQEDFFDVPCEQLAKSLLGKVLVRRQNDGTLIRGRIVETECYPGGEDKGSCSYQGKITERTKAVFMKPGVMFVYLTYGMYHCFNISSQGPGAAVLLRAVEPLDGIEHMQQERAAMKKGTKKPELKEHELCNGPAKLCICFNITKKDCNMRDLCVWDDMWVEADDLSSKLEPCHIITSTRIGIDYVGPKWASLPLRFYLFGYKSVSRVDKAKEKALEGVCRILS